MTLKVSFRFKPIIYGAAFLSASVMPFVIGRFLNAMGVDNSG
jgi:hypothetical protein